MDQTIRLLVIGGGYAGVKAAQDFHKAYKRQENVEITLVDKNRFHTLMTELHEIAGDRVPQASVKVSYDRIFSGTRVNVVHDEIQNIDFEENVAQGCIDKYAYDYVVIATGGQPADFNIPGIKDHTLSLWSLDDALLIRNQLERNFRQASLEPDPKLRGSLMSVVVAGAGFTGVELVGELLEFLPTLCKKYDLPEDEIRLYNVEALGHILDMLPESQRDKAVRYMEKNGVEIRTNALITKAEEGAFHFKDGSVLEAGTLVWTCGVKGNCFIGCLDLKEGKAGRKEVDQYMRSPGHENVFLAGDGVWFLEEGKPVPQIVEAAEQTAETAAHNIIVEVDRKLGRKSKGEPKAYSGRYHGFMVSIGSKYAVSHTGGISLSGFLAVALKHVVNLYYQFGIVGLNGMWAYLKHEILDIRHNRSLIGGFATWKTPNYWLVPLRMYVGIMWFLQGIHKARTGWLNRANDFVSVATSSGGDAVTGATWGAEGAAEATEQAAEAVAAASEWTESASDAVGQAANSAADAVAAASEWAETAVETAADAVSAATVGGEAAASYGAALLDKPLDIYVWISQLTVNQAPFFFQSGIVIFEILIGLALLGGAFTWLSAAASFVFSIMLIVGGMTDASIFWYMLAAIALLGGAGRSFGLDYWIMPFLKRWWNGTGLARRTHFYVGEPTRKKRK
jgi:NADH dehydrogenase